MAVNVLTYMNQCNFNMQPINAMFVIEYYIIIYIFFLNFRDGVGGWGGNTATN